MVNLTAGVRTRVVLRLISIHMEDPDYQLPLDLADFRSRYSMIPFTRRQHVVNMIHTVKNIKETMTTITIDFKHRHQRFLRSTGGDVTPMADTTLPILNFVTFPQSTLKCEFDDERLLSPTERHSLIHRLLSYFNLTSLGELANLETEVSLCLFNLVSTAKDEGYNAIDVILFIEVATIDTYEAEDIALAMRRRESAPISVTSPAPRSCPAPRSSIEALFSQVFDNRNSSDLCDICLNEYSCGVTVTRLPCSHDFHRGCIEIWLNANNSCPMCRSPI